MRLIDADALMNDLMKVRYVYQMLDNTQHADIAMGGLRKAEKKVEEAPTVDAVPRWIPCEERLPEPNVAVLGYAPKFDNIFAVYYDSVCGWITWNPVHDEPFPSFQGEIVAWMPLPEPYRGERKDDE